MSLCPDPTEGGCPEAQTSHSIPTHPGGRLCCVHLLNLYMGKLRPPGTGRVHLIHVQTRAGQALHVKDTLGLGGVG